MRVALTGATGYVGHAIGLRLQGDGHRLRVLRRRGPAIRTLDAEAFRGDLASAEWCDSFVTGCDAVVHAALDHLPGLYRGGEGSDAAAFVDRNLTASARLFSASMRQRARFVFLSSRAVFDGLNVRLPGLVDDDERPAPTTLYGGCKAAIEQLIRVTPAESGLCTTIRMTGVYGPTSPVREAKWLRLVEGVAQGKTIDVSRSGSEVAVEDVAELVSKALDAGPDEVAGQAINCSDLVVTTGDLVAMAGTRLAMPAKTKGSPVPPINVLDNRRMRALGVSPGGREGVERCIDEICAEVTANR